MTNFPDPKFYIFIGTKFKTQSKIKRSNLRGTPLKYFSTKTFVRTNLWAVNVKAKEWNYKSFSERVLYARNKLLNGARPAVVGGTPITEELAAVSILFMSSTFCQLCSRNSCFCELRFFVLDVTAFTELSANLGREVTTTLFSRPILGFIFRFLGLLQKMWN